MTNRVMFIAPSAYTLGGAQTWLDYLLPGLRHKGWEVTLGLVSGRLHDVGEYLRLHHFEPACRIEAPTGTREGRVRGLMSAIEACRPDIVVVLNIVDAYEAVARLRQERNLSIKVVATLHGLQPDFLEDYEMLRDHLDAVVCSNQLAAALATKVSGLSPKRVFDAPYGVDLSRTVVDRRTAEGPLRIAYSGRLESHQKRVSDVCGILSACVASGLDVCLKVAGTGPEEDRFNDMVRREGLESRVQVLGVLDEGDLRSRLYRRCDVLLLTSSWETGPIVAWEAMSEGLALVTSDYLGRSREGSLEDRVNCRVFPVGDIAAAVDCLRELQSRSVRNRLAQAGRELVLRKYTREKSVDRWSECLTLVQLLGALPERAIPSHAQAQGRLDRYLGTAAAEQVRRLLGRSYRHRDPGGEWPHSYGSRSPDDPRFWSLAQGLDKCAQSMENEIESA